MRETYQKPPLYGDSRKRRRVLLCVASQNIGVQSFREAGEVDTQKCGSVVMVMVMMVTVLVVVIDATGVILTVLALGFKLNGHVTYSELS